MASFTVHDLQSAPEGSKPLLAGVKSAWGFVPKLQGTLAESPTALAAYDALWDLVARSTLSPTEQQVVYLAVNVFHGCEYCTAGHTWLARKAGLDESAIQALRGGTPIDDPRLQALRSFTEAVLQERGRVGDARVDAFLSAGFTKENVLEVVTVIATKTISNYTNHLTHTPHESFMADPALAWTAPRHREIAA